MADAKKLEVEVKKYAGDDGEEIIEAVRKLAEVDLKIKSQMDEIERIDEDLPAKHNELADKINGLIDKVCDDQGDSDAEGEQKEPEPKKEEKPNKVHTIHVVVQRMPPVVHSRIPWALMALMDFLNS